MVFYIFIVQQEKAKKDNSKNKPKLQSLLNISLRNSFKLLLT